MSNNNKQTINTIGGAHVFEYVERTSFGRIRCVKKKIANQPDTCSSVCVVYIFKCTQET